MRRLHRIILHNLGWPIAVYEGDHQLVCEEDYVQISDVFFVATKNPETIRLVKLEWDRFERAPEPMPDDVRKALPPDEIERYERVRATWGAAKARDL